MRFEGGSAHEEQTNALYIDNGGYPAGFCAADAADEELELLNVSKLNPGDEVR